MGKPQSLTLRSAGKRTEFTCWPAVKHSPSSSKEHIQPLAGSASGRGHAKLAFLQRGECATSWVLGELQSRRQHQRARGLLWADDSHRPPARQCSSLPGSLSPWAPATPGSSVLMVKLLDPQSPCSMEMITETAHPRLTVRTHAQW